MNSKNHCMIVHSYYPLREPRVEREAQALIQAGYQVDVICLRMEGESAEDLVEGVKIYRMPVRRHRGQGPVVQLLEYLSFFLLASLTLNRLYFKRKYSIVQVHNLPDFLIFCAWLPKLFGAKLVLDLHDLMPEFFASSYKKDMASLLVRLLILQEQLSCRFADHVITVTELWRKTLEERGVPHRKTGVVMNLANAKVFHQQGSRDERADPEKFSLIYHGTLARRYGIDLIIRAVAELRAKIPGLQLTIHGGGEFSGELEALVEQLGLQQQVTFSRQYLPIHQLPALIRSADLGVVPYRRDLFTDGILPTKLIEYMALGMPVVAARTPVIEAYFDGMVEFFPAGEVQGLAAAIESLYLNPERRAALARSTERFNERYTWVGMAREYVSQMNKLNGIPNSEGREVAEVASGEGVGV